MGRSVFFNESNITPILDPLQQFVLHVPLTQNMNDWFGQLIAYPTVGSLTGAGISAYRLPTNQTFSYAETVWT